jgi:hypothetical protein
VGNGLFAVWAGCADADASAVEVAVGAAAGVEESLFASRAFVDHDRFDRFDRFRWWGRVWSPVPVRGLTAR